jgi:hypothetical protein
MTRRQFAGPQYTQAPDPISNLAEVKIDGGMNVYVDSADLPNNTLVLARNVLARSDRLIRVPGSELITPAKPDSNRPVTLYVFQRFAGTSVFLRFTKTAVQLRGTSAWTTLTTSDAFTITDTDRIRVLPFNDRLFFVTGNQNIYEAEFSGNTYNHIGNAPRYKYITGFFNRIVGANLYDTTTPNPTLVGWSGDLNFDEWDPAADISAGSTPLLEGASDFADPITGLFGFASVMLILRERSLWTASKRPVASSPFSFQAAFPSVGCDCPNTAAQKRNGLVWYDYRSNQVYDYTLGERPQEIGDPVKNLIKSRIGNKELPLGSYNPIQDEYVLTIPGQITNTTYIYTYNFSGGQWTEQTIENCNGSYPLDSFVSGLSIDELSGPIDSLTGTIDSLTSVQTSPPASFYAMANGDILVTNENLDTDNAVAIESILESKVYKLPDRAISVNRIRFTYICRREGSFVVEYNKGNGWVALKTITVVIADIDIRKRVSIAKHIRAREMQWRIRTTTGSFEFLDYSLDLQPSDFGKV